MAIDTCFFLGLAFFFLFLFVRGFHCHRNFPPSLGSLPIIGHLHLLKKPLHQSLANISSRHGPILSLRFGSRRVLLVSSAAAAEECLSKNDLAFANRPRFLAGKHLGYDYTTITWASYGSHWRNLRRLVTFEIFSASRLVSFSGIREDEVGAMLRSIAKDSQIGAGGGVVEMRKRFFELSFNIMMQMVAGKRFYSDDACMKDECTRFHDIVTETFAVSGSTNLSDFLPFLRWFGLNGSEKKLKRLQEKTDSFIQDLVDERRKECSRRSSRADEEGKRPAARAGNA
ncbi:hypothetical protein HPP92_014239 [Vanilla planifolia]|uniref:Cytochrome P450 n=1 Tax=Vanilla planifolia TaxID=51239 RepID=A0A835UXG2_VANPL|nr:hypothetical protein HPP92_014239 [Vanilla planifolia]